MVHLQGTPQGCVLSPLLFSLYISNIKSYLPPQVKSVQYADDILLYCSHKKYDIGHRHMQMSIKQLEIYFKELHMEINARKSNIIIISRSKHIELNLQYFLNGHRLPIVDTMKVLGVHVDNKLTFKTHISNLVQKCSKDLNILKSLSCRTNGAHPEFILQIYKSLIRSKLDYGCFLYGHSNQLYLNKIDCIQNQALRIALGAFRSTPIVAMNAEASLMPMSLRRNLLTDRLVYKIFTQSNHPGYLSLIYLCSAFSEMQYWAKKRKPLFIHSFKCITDINPNFSSNTEHKQQWDFDEPLFMVSKENKPRISPIIADSNIKISKKLQKDIVTNQVVNEQMNITYKDHVFVYTDGSKSKNGVGAAFHIPNLNFYVKYSLNKYMSSYTAEVVAILKSIQHINNLNDNNFVICTDSQAAVTAIENSFEGLPNQQSIILSVVYELITSKKNIVVQWIPAHIGIIGNEKADKLAKEAIIDGIKYDELHIPLDDFNANQKRYYFSKCNESFKSTNKAKWYKKIVDSVPKYPWFKHVKFKRWEIINLTRMRFGHANVNSSLFNIGKYFTPMCLQCTLGHNETLEHIFVICPAYDYARKQCFNEIRKKFGTNNQNFIKILESNDIKIFKELNSFLGAIKKFI
uniref:Reverse transcriptase domain-containing protein n=1 Tax=Graphocephala atropunctata TaxID=36148 RepID=A0A1B6LNL6_9HEMI